MLDSLSTASNFHHENSTGLQVACCPQHDFAHQVEPIPAAGQSHAGLVPVFAWQSAHGRRGHVGRITHDKVVAPAG
jgi:hypothetical protein